VFILLAGLTGFLRAYLINRLLVSPYAIIWLFTWPTALYNVNETLSQSVGAETNIFVWFYTWWHAKFEQRSTVFTGYLHVIQLAAELYCLLRWCCDKWKYVVLTLQYSMIYLSSRISMEYHVYRVDKMWWNLFSYLIMIKEL
jgi:hypothetical protein